MKIVCDRCEKQTTNFKSRDDWGCIEYSEQGYGKLGDYYICPKCAKEFMDFMKNGKGGADHE